MTKSGIKVILFDLGRVLMHIDFEAFPEALGLHTKETRLQFDQERIQQDLREYETGRMTTVEFFNSLHGIFRREYSTEKIREAFDGIIVSDNNDIRPFVEHARRHHRIALLSNTCSIHWEKVLRISSLIKLFPDLYTSFQLNAMKPDRKAYEKVCLSLKVKPHEVLFIDDLKENIDGAISYGMHGIIFSNVDQLRREYETIMRKMDLK